MTSATGPKRERPRRGTDSVERDASKYSLSAELDLLSIGGALSREKPAWSPLRSEPYGCFSVRRKLEPLAWSSAGNAVTRTHHYDSNGPLRQLED